MNGTNSAVGLRMSVYDSIASVYCVDAGSVRANATTTKNPTSVRMNGIQMSRRVRNIPGRAARSARTSGRWNLDPLMGDAAVVFWGWDAALGSSSLIMLSPETPPAS